MVLESCSLRLLLPISIGICGSVQGHIDLTNTTSHPTCSGGGKITPTKFQTTGYHYLDLLRWLLNEDAPAVISAHGGKYVVDDDRTIPDTMHVTYEFKSGVLVTLTHFGR